MKLNLIHGMLLAGRQDIFRGNSLRVLPHAKESGCLIKWSMITGWPVGAECWVEKENKKYMMGINIDGCMWLLVSYICIIPL